MWVMIRGYEDTGDVSMLMIKLLSVAAVVVIFVTGIQRFNQHFEGKFGHAFFTKTAFFITAAACYTPVICGGSQRYTTTAIG
jgi:hypothetical protein